MSIANVIHYNLGRRLRGSFLKHALVDKSCKFEIHLNHMLGQPNATGSGKPHLLTKFIAETFSVMTMGKTNLVVGADHVLKVLS